ncbi:MAG: M15 family metallopeptidase [Erysipelotrichaceae bacterium]
MKIMISLMIALVMLGSGCTDSKKEEVKKEDIVIKDEVDKTDEKVEVKVVDEFRDIKYYRDGLKDRYSEYAKLHSDYKIERVVSDVNIGLDTPFFSNIEEIKDTSDVAMVINKYHILPNGYVPDDMIKTPFPCIQGVDDSCTTGNSQMIVRSAGEALKKLGEACIAQGFNIRSISSYRSYNYQKNLYDYFLNNNGQEYADTYYARPGQSEHNSGLAVDITIDNYNFTEIQNSPNYQWLLDNIANYGFILRYPEDRIDNTGFAYESWHLRYVGIDIAKDIKKRNITLDEYQAQK